MPPRKKPSAVYSEKWASLRRTYSPAEPNTAKSLPIYCIRPPLSSPLISPGSMELPQMNTSMATTRAQ